MKKTMKTIQGIGCLAVIAFILYVVGTILVHNYDTRFERATQNADKTAEERVERTTETAWRGYEAAIETEVAAANVEAARLCHTAIATQDRGTYSGHVFLYEEVDPTASMAVSYDHLINLGDLSHYTSSGLQHAEAILCINFLGTEERDCQFDVPATTVHFIYAKAVFTLVAWPSGDYIGGGPVSGRRSTCPYTWSGICENNRCVGYNQIDAGGWLDDHLMAGPVPTSEALPAGGVCWTNQVTNFDGTRSQAWDSLLDDETRKLLQYEQFLVEVVAHNPQLEADGYGFHGEKTYLFPELCQ